MIDWFDPIIISILSNNYDKDLLEKNDHFSVY